MSIFIYVQSLIFIILEVFCCKTFLETFSIMRKKKLLTQTFTIVSLTVTYYLSAMIFDDNFFIKVIFIALITSFIGFIFYNISIIKAIILAVLFQALLLSIDYLTVVLISIFKLYTEDFQINNFLFIILGKIILWLTILIINKKLGKTNNILKDRELGKILIIPIYSITTITGIIITSDANNDRNIFSILTAISIVGLNIIIFYVINSIIIRERKINQVNSDLIKYKAKLENEEKLKQKAHEYRNSLACILSLLKQNEVSRTIKYIENKNKENLIDLGMIMTNHPVVNSIINIKYKEAAEKNITIEYKIDDLGTISTSDDDIMIILCNLLDNAIEASEKCLNYRKNINIKITKDSYNIFISVSNKYEHNIIYNNGKIVTDKFDNENHGLGIKNIIETVKKNNGKYEINDVINSDNEKVFNFTIILPL